MVFLQNLLPGCRIRLKAQAIKSVIIIKSIPKLFFPKVMRVIKRDRLVIILIR